MNRKVFLVFVVLMATGISLMAAPPPPPGSNNATPIDAGIALLGAVGAVVAGRKLLKSK